MGAENAAVVATLKGRLSTTSEAYALLSMARLSLTEASSNVQHPCCLWALWVSMDRGARPHCRSASPAAHLGSRCTADASQFLLTAMSQDHRLAVHQPHNNLFQHACSYGSGATQARSSHTPRLPKQLLRRSLPQHAACPPALPTARARRHPAESLLEHPSSLRLLGWPLGAAHTTRPSSASASSRRRTKKTTGSRRSVPW